MFGKQMMEKQEITLCFVIQVDIATALDNTKRKVGIKVETPIILQTQI